ncbi:MAG: DHA2 family efflux MFS transporter permease subunit [Clostridia bacterium]
MSERAQHRDGAGASGVRNVWARLPLESMVAKPGYIWMVVGTVCVGAFMAAVDASIVSVALPTMQGYFHATGSDTSWVLIAYLLTLASLVTALGRWADMVGRRPLYTLGFLVFIVGSALCGAAVSLPMLIGARVLQAAGAAMLQANSVAIITATVPASVRGKAIGIQGSAQAVGLSIGPAVGGALIALLGWRAIFYVNVPVGILGTALGALLLPRDRLDAERKPFDWYGLVFFAPVLATLLLAITEGPTWGWTSPRILVLFAAALGLGLAFVARERHFRFPMIDLNLFKIKVMTVGNVTGLLSYAAMFGTLYLIPYFAKDVVHVPESVAGLLLTPVPVAMTILAPIAGGLADRYGSRILTTVGMALTGLGTLLLAMTLGRQVSFVAVVGELILVGAGLGLFTPPNNSSVMGAAPREHLGLSGGILNMARSLGMSWGAAMPATMVSISLLMAHASTRHASPDQWSTAIHVAFVGLSVLAFIAAAMSVGRRSGPRLSHDAHPIELA